MSEIETTGEEKPATEKSKASSVVTKPETEQNGKKSVRFDAPSDEERKLEAARRRKKRNQELRARHRFTLGGSGKSNVYGQVATFVLCVIGMFTYAYKCFLAEFEDGPSTVPEKGTTWDGAVASTLNNAVESLTKKIMENTEKRRRKDPCSLYMTKSTIVEAGDGLFAGEYYKQGDTVITTPWFIPVGGGENHESDSELAVSSVALVLKFHPTLANIDGVVVKQKSSQGDDVEEHAFVATRPILEGDELFLPVEKHPAFLLESDNPVLAKLFRERIPTMADYILADEITAKITTMGNQMNMKHARIYGSPLGSTSPLYALGSSIASKLDSKFKQLIPGNLKEYDKRKNSPSYLSALDNRTISDLQILGSCLSDMDAALNEETQQITTSSLRQFEKDDVVSVIPLYVMLQSASCSTEANSEDTEPQCTYSKSDYCISAADSRVELCSLSSFPIQDLTGVDGSIEWHANIEIRWKTQNTDQLTLADLSEQLPGSLQLEAVALSSIEVGDQLVTSNSRSMAETLIPRSWRES